MTSATALTRSSAWDPVRAEQTTHFFGHNCEKNTFFCTYRAPTASLGVRVTVKSHRNRLPAVKWPHTCIVMFVYTNLWAKTRTNDLISSQQACSQLAMSTCC
jgi:hypothetical protein